MSDLALSIVLGIALAAATGFRVFLPMLIMSGAAYTGHLSLDNNFAWLGTPSALTMLSVAALAEVLAYYVPVVDNLLNSLATPAAFSRGDSRVSGGYDRRAANGEMDRGCYRGWRHRQPHARGDRNAQGSLHRFDRRSWQLGHRNRGARRRAPDVLSGLGGTRCRNRAGHPVFVAGDTSAPPALSRSEIIGRPKIEPVYPPGNAYPIPCGMCCPE